MAQYIDKDTLMAEIEKRKEAFETSDGRRFHSLSDQILWNAFNSIQDIINTLEAKELDFWHKQSEEDIDDSVISWSMHSFICLMKDGTTQKFTGIQVESYEGSINKHLDCVDDNYEWEYDDIIYWIEVPNIKSQKGEKI